MRRKWIAIGVIFTIIIFITLNVIKQRGASSAEMVETIDVKEELLGEKVIVPGKLELAKEQEIYFDEDKGKIDEILVKEGDIVDKGTSIIRYENQSWKNEKKQNELQLKSSLSELELLRKQHAQIDKKLKENPKDELIQLEHDEISHNEQSLSIEIEKMQSETQFIDNQIKEGTVNSSIDGTVISIDDEAVNESKQTVQNPLVQIGSLGSFIVKGEISEYDTLKIKKNQSVKLTTDAIPEKEWEGKVNKIAYSPSNENMDNNDKKATYEIIATIKDENLNLRPGFEMLMEVEIEEKAVKTLPLDAILQEEDKAYAFVIVNGRAKRKNISLGTSTNEIIEVKDGLNIKDKVILNPIDIKDGTEVIEQ